MNPLTPREVAALDQVVATTQELIDNTVKLIGDDRCGHSTHSERLLCLAENLREQVDHDQLALAVALMAHRLGGAP